MAYLNFLSLHYLGVLVQGAYDVTDYANTFAYKGNYSYKQWHGPRTEIYLDAVS